MESKKRFAAMDNLFKNIDPYGAGALSPTAPAAAPVTVIFAPLDQVRPDPDQPRRVLPPALLARFRQTGDAAAALAAWAQLGQSEGAARAAYAELQALADTLAIDGLINPITVVTTPDGYRILSGERRWWAHQLLAAQGRTVKNGQPGNVAVLIRPAEEITPTLQLVENLHRQDLCAVEVALGVATLIEQLADGPDESVTTVTLSPTAAPRDSAQSVTTVTLSPADRLSRLQAVARRRLQAGTWDEIRARLGRTRPHWVHHLALLRLPDDVLLLAWEHRLSERALRPVVAEKDPRRQRRLIERLVQQHSAAEADSPVGAAPTTPAPAAAPFSQQLAGDLRRFQRTLDRTTDHTARPQTVVKELTQAANFEEILKTAQRLKPFIDALVQAVAKK